MQGLGLETDLVISSTASSACEKGYQPERALELLAEIRGLGLEPDEITYNATINAREN